MSPAWWEDDPTLAENQPEGRALRLLRRFLSPEQLWGLDEKHYFRVQGKEHSYLFLRGNPYIYRVAETGEPGRSLFSGDMALQVTHQLCIHAVEHMPPMTYREYYKAMGLNGMFYLKTTAQDILDQPMAEAYRYIQLPLYDSLLAKKLLIENDEPALWKIAVSNSLVPLGMTRAEVAAAFAPVVWF